MFFFMNPEQLRKVPSGAMQVPDSLSSRDLPPAVTAAILRLLEAGPKPAVSLQVMDQTQSSMLAPDLPWKANV